MTVQKLRFRICCIVFLPLVALANPPVAIKQKIKALNNYIVEEKFQEIEDLSDEIRPKHFIAYCNDSSIKNDFYVQAPKILKLITFLEENRDRLECEECLDSIIEIFYWQCQKFINDIDLEKVVLDESLSEPVSQHHVKKRLLEILFRIYYFHNLEEDDFIYPYDITPLSLLTTRMIINAFIAKTHLCWGFRERSCFLYEQFFVVKNKLRNSMYRNQRSIASGRYVDIKKMEWFVDNLQEIFIKSCAPVSWKGFIYKTVGVVAASLFTIFVLYQGWNLVKSAYSTVSTDIDNKISHAGRELGNFGEHFGERLGENASNNLSRAAERLGNNVQRVGGELNQTIRTVGPNLGMRTAEELRAIAPTIGIRTAEEFGDTLGDALIQSEVILDKELHKLDSMVGRIEEPANVIANEGVVRVRSRGSYCGIM